MPFTGSCPRLKPSEVMAEREYKFDAEPTKKIMVRIGFPRRVEGGDRYVCIAEVDDGLRVDVKPMNGQDAFEALTLALELIAVDLADIVDEMGRPISWANGTRHDIGFSCS